MNAFDQPAWVWFLLILSSWLAATISGAAGFGGALVLLPVLSNTIGPKAAVPVLTVAQLLGNLSRVYFGWRLVAWRSVACFVAGSIPASVLGGVTFASLPRGSLTGVIGAALLVVVLVRRTRLARRRLGGAGLALAGIVVGYLSAVAGSAGPLGAAVFLSLDLEPLAYVASEAVTAVAMHLTKSIVYQRYQFMGAVELALGIVLGGAMILGSWTGKRLIERLPRDRFIRFVEVLLFISGLELIASAIFLPH